MKNSNFMTTAQDGGKVVSLTHRPPLPARKYCWYSFLLEAESTPGPQCDRKEFMSIKNSSFMTTVQDGGKVVSFTRRPPLPSRKFSWYSFLLEAESTPGTYYDRKEFMSIKNSNFMTTAQDGGKVVSLTHRPPLSPRK